MARADRIWRRPRPPFRRWRPRSRPDLGGGETDTRPLAGAQSSGDDDLLRPEIYPVAGGLFARAFKTSSPYANEEIVYEATSLRSGSQMPFAARCQKWNAPEATCLRHMPLGSGLTMTYCFPRTRLADWGRLDRSLTLLISGFIASAR
ncbi:hypothetical protein [Breoghania sp.]|uniref:hypothetical protein n=1 Tax=Breoghania sp. TaxID=2065378 RepID=UPI002621D7ED|nr:hypothetical protein [Breoghania sp.]MDJ0931975.1 hypothetical protein [Breoghania sp.]